MSLKGPRVSIVLDQRDKYHKIIFNSYYLDLELKRGDATSKDVLNVIEEVLTSLGFDVVTEVVGEE